MDISRRRLLQAVAAAPLATVPSIVFGSVDRLPTPQEVLANGSNITVTCKWTDDEMMTLSAYCAAFAYVGYKKTPESKILGEQVSNYIDFMLNNAEPTHVVFGVKAMLTTYRLPLRPGHVRSFDRFHKEAGEYIVAAVDGPVMSSIDAAKQPLVDAEMLAKINTILRDPGFAKKYLVL